MTAAGWGVLFAPGGVGGAHGGRRESESTYCLCANGYLPAVCLPENVLGKVPVKVAFCADSEGNGRDWQARSFLIAVVDVDGVSYGPRDCVA